MNLELAFEEWGQPKSLLTAIQMQKEGGGNFPELTMFSSKVT